MYADCINFLRLTGDLPEEIIAAYDKFIFNR